MREMNEGGREGAGPSSTLSGRDLGASRCEPRSMRTLSNSVFREYARDNSTRAIVAAQCVAKGSP